MAEITPKDRNQKLRWSRRLSWVPRWTAMPVIRQQMVDAHSFHVVHIALWLTDFHKDNEALDFRGSVVMKALEHDIDEAVTGDHPSPNKKKREYQEHEQVAIIVKLADLLEAIAFVEEEYQLGNRTLEQVGVVKRKEFHELWPLFKYSMLPTTRPLASDLIRMFLDTIALKRHPMSEVNNERP